MQFVEFADLIEKLWLRKKEPVRNWLEDLIALDKALSDQTEVENWWLLKARVLLLYAVADHYQGKYETSQKALGEAQAILESVADPYWYGRLLFTSGVIKATMGLLTVALKDLSAALSLSMAYTFTDIQVVALYNMGVLYLTNMHQPKEAIAIFKEGLLVAEGIEASENDRVPRLTYSNMITGLGRAAIECGELSELEGYIGQALSASALTQSDRKIGWTYEMVSQGYAALKNYEKAHHYAHLFLDISIERGEPFMVGNAQLNLARLMMTEQRFEDAASRAHLARELFETQGGKNVIDEVYLVLSTAYEKMGIFEDSLKYRKAYDEVLKERNTREMELQMNYLSAQLNVETARRDAEIFKLKHVELVDAMEALQTAQEKLIKSEKLSSVIGVISNIAHEINTPLGNALMLCSYLEDQVAESACETASESKEIIERINQNIRKATSIVTHIKQHAIHPQTLNKTNLEIREFCNHWLDQLASYRVNSTNEAFNWEPNLVIEGCGNFIGDKESLFQMLNALYENVTYHAYDHVRPNATLAVSHDGNQVSFVFEDWGKGLLPSVKDKAFEPFAKGLGQRQNSERLGLGLYLAYTVANMVHGGQIKIITTPDRPQGTLVQILLPAAQ